MNRKLVSKEELVSILNSELLKHEECKGCRFEGVLELIGEVKDECNWSRTTVPVRCSGVLACREGNC
jgi:hypothetical protein